MQEKAVELVKASRAFTDAVWDLSLHLLAWERIVPAQAIRGAVVRTRKAETMMMAVDRLVNQLAMDLAQAEVELSSTKAK